VQTLLLLWEHVVVQAVWEARKIDVSKDQLQYEWPQLKNSL